MPNKVKGIDAITLPVYKELMKHIEEIKSQLNNIDLTKLPTIDDRWGVTEEEFNACINKVFMCNGFIWYPIQETDNNDVMYVGISPGEEMLMIGELYQDGPDYIFTETFNSRTMKVVKVTVESIGDVEEYVDEYIDTIDYNNPPDILYFIDEDGSYEFYYRQEKGAFNDNEIGYLCVCGNYVQRMKLTVDGLTFELNKISKVIANPTLAGTESALEGLQVENTKYKISGGTKLYKHIININSSLMTSGFAVVGPPFTQLVFISTSNEAVTSIVSSAAGLTLNNIRNVIIQPRINNLQKPIFIGEATVLYFYGIDNSSYVNIFNSTGTVTDTVTEL